MPWLLFLITACCGLHYAESLAAYVAISASEIRYAIGGLLLGLPIALAISAFGQRVTSLRRRFSRY